MGYCAAISGNSLPTFRNNLSVPTSRAIGPMGPIGCSDTSVMNYHHSLRNNPDGRSSHLLRGGSLKSPTIYNIHFPHFLQCIFTPNWEWCNEWNEVWKSRRTTLQFVWASLSMSVIWQHYIFPSGFNCCGCGYCRTL